MKIIGIVKHWSGSDLKWANVFKSFPHSSIIS